MTIAAIYPETARKILMLGLGGGSISTYLGRFMPEAAITTVEIDPGVITAAKTYFGLRETERMRYHAGDGRVFLSRNDELYDLILLDLYPSGVGEVIAVASASPLDSRTLERRAATLQERHGFRFPLPQILRRRLEQPRLQAANGDVITDDFAPADVYDVIGKDARRRK